MVRKILPATDKRLREKSRGVSRVDKKALSLIKDLKDTLNTQKDPEGIGLAAPQIGKNLRIFVINYGKLNKAFVNPEIVNIEKSLAKTKKKKRQTIMEGCLSLPNFYGPLKRAKKVTLKFLNEKGNEEISQFDGFYAQIILHEMDHLEGVLFIDRLIEQKKPLYKFDGNEWEEVELL